MNSFSRIGLLALVVVAGCNPYAYAPPVRSTHYGAPDRVQPGRLDLSGAMNVIEIPGGPRLGYAVNEWLQLEGGADLAIYEGHWGIGYGGARFTMPAWSRGIVRLTSDLELGAGLGVGGEINCYDDEETSSSEYCQEENTTDAFDRLAGGGYFGAGFGVHVSFFSVFIRGRVQITKASEIPSTLWGSSVGGIAFDIGDWVDIYAAGGIAGFYNEISAYYGAIAEFGVSIDIPIRRTEPVPTTATL